MHSESELRRLLANTDGQSAPIALARVLRRSSHRRRTRQCAVVISSAFAVLGISIAAVTGLGGLGAGSPSSVSGVAYSTESQSADSLATPDNPPQIALGPVGSATECGAPFSTDTSHNSELTVTTDLSADSGPGGRISGTVTLTNSSRERIVGVSSPTPVVTLWQNGRNLWTSISPMVSSAESLDLRPGQSRSYSVTLSPVQCVPLENSASDPPSTQRELIPGTYQLSAAIAFTVYGSTGFDSRFETPDTTTLVTSTRSDLTIR